MVCSWVRDELSKHTTVEDCKIHVVAVTAWFFGLFTALNFRDFLLPCYKLIQKAVRRERKGVREATVPDNDS